MNRISKILLGCILVCAFVLTSCAADPVAETGTAPETSAETEKATQPVSVTVDEVLKAAGLSKEDLPGVDVEAFIADEQITAEVLNQLQSDLLREVLLSMVQPETVSFEYLISGETITLAEGETIDISQIKRIAVVSTNDTLLPSVLIDLEEGKAYYADGYFFSDLSCAGKVTELTEVLREEVLTAVEAAGIDSWEIAYMDSEETVDSYGEMYHFVAGTWVIAFETADGVVRFCASGVDSPAPQSFYDLGVQLYNLFW